jgi:hypothetical protein
MKMLANGVDDRPLLDPISAAGSPSSTGSGSRPNSPSTPKKPITAAQKCALVCLYLILLTQWLVITLSSSFFPESGPGRPISAAVQGLIFAAMPLGSTVASPFVEPIMQCLGSTRLTLLLGLASMVVLTLALGAVPFVVAGAPAAYPFMVLGLVYGAGSTLAELGAYATVTQIGAQTGNVGFLVSIAEVMMGVGAMVGPPIGGGVFAAGGALGLSSDWQFMLPFLVATVPSVFCLIAVMVLMRGKEEKEDKDAEEGEGEKDGDEEDDDPVSPGQRKPCCKRPFGCRHFMLMGCAAYTAVVTSMLSPMLEIALDFLGVPQASLASTTGYYFFVLAFM